MGCTFPRVGFDGLLGGGDGRGAGVGGFCPKATGTSNPIANANSTKTRTRRLTGLFTGRNTRGKNSRPHISASQDSGRVAHLKLQEGVPHPLRFSKGAFFALEFPRHPPNPYVSNLLPALIRTPSAPWLVPGMFHQLPRHRIRMHVISISPSSCRGYTCLNHRTVVAKIASARFALAEMQVGVAMSNFVSFAAASSLPHRSRHSLLQNLHSLRWCPCMGSPINRCSCSGISPPASSRAWS